MQTAGGKGRSVEDFFYNDYGDNMIIYDNYYRPL